jgi:endonuclease/exonuclease/phosphatase family metal-dependent hydrolase
MTYNIWMGGRRAPALRDCVREVCPDVLLVNESPKTPLVWRRRCRRRCEEWGMRYVAGGRDAGSNMIVVGDGVEVTSVFVMTVRQPLFQPRRGIAAAQLRVRGVPVGVVSCHLSLDGGRRVAEIERVVEVAGRLHGTVLIGGDLNEKPGGPCWRRLEAAGYVDHGSRDWLTFPAVNPVKRIDALVVRGDAAVAHHGDPGVDAQLQAWASDHRAVLAVLDV